MPQPKRAAKPLSPEQRDRAKELQEKNGIARRFAVRVARDEMTVGDALRQMLRDEKAERLASELDVPRSLAAQLIDGTVDRDRVLLKRRARETVRAHASRSVFDQACSSNDPICLVLDAGEPRIGTVSSVDTYDIMFRPEKGEAESVRKLFVHYACAPRGLAAVTAAVGVDPEVAGRDLGPEPRPSLRPKLKNVVFQQLLDDGSAGTLTTRRGWTLTGQVTWFNQFEVGLQLRGDEAVTVFRHALEKVTAA